jgi:hypothetical protein
MECMNAGMNRKPLAVSANNIFKKTYIFKKKEISMEYERQVRRFDIDEE